MAKREQRQREPGTPATLSLTKAGIAFTSHVYDHDPAAPSYGLEAAAVLGLAPAEVFKTLMAMVDGQPAIAVLPVDRTLDLKALAAALGGRRAEMADPAIAQRLTGYVVGGISPIGQKKALPTVIDASAQDLPRMYVSGGQRGFDIGLAPDDLARATGAMFAAIARAGRP
jgi:Cys-tRNA(Pro)/Cys-tRNA(Cys) deacylase